MDDAALVLGGWAVILGSMALYSWRLIRRGRALTLRNVPPEHRRWM